MRDTVFPDFFNKQTNMNPIVPEILSEIQGNKTLFSVESEKTKEIFCTFKKNIYLCTRFQGAHSSVG